MIINIPLQLDEATLEGQISKEYEKKVKDIIATRIEELLAENYRGYWNESQSSKAKNGLALLVRASIDEFLNSNRDVIVEAASKELSEKLWRTKRVKEAVANVIERENGDERGKKREDLCWPEGCVD